MIRIQRRRTKGWKMPPLTKYCGRGTVLGNPYEVVEIKGLCYVQRGDYKAGGFSRYDAHLLAVDLYRYIRYPDIREKARELCEGYENLSCFCSLELPCHVDVIIEDLRQV